MSFTVAADAYNRFMGRFSEPLAALFVGRAGVRPGQRALDVGCGPGAMTSVLTEWLGAAAVTAVDPSASFVAAARQRHRDVAVVSAVAEELPFADDSFDLTAAQLVVQFMSDPVAGLHEMARVTRPGGTVAACVWDHDGGSGPLALFWQAVRDLDPAALGEGDRPGTREGDLVRLFADAGLPAPLGDRLTVEIEVGSFEEWWEPFTLGVGPAGDYVASLAPDRRDALATRMAGLLPAKPFTVRATAWYAEATVGAAPGARGR
ncbi:class I SAM-dependent methyltransferase [Nocardioides pacificus]